MKSKKMYRIELAESNAILNEICLMAVLSNGGRYLSLTDLESVAKANYVRYSDSGKSVTVSLIGNTLLVDRGTELLLRIDEVEVMDLEMHQITSQEAKDILDELAPTLHRQTGLLDETNPELLN